MFSGHTHNQHAQQKTTTTKKTHRIYLDCCSFDVLKNTKDIDDIDPESLCEWCL